MKQQIKKVTIFGNDNQPVDVVLRVAPRAKNMSIKITAHKGVEVVVPKGVTYKGALMFLYKQKQWVIDKRRHVKLKPKSVLQAGSEVPIFDKKYTIVYSGNIRGITTMLDNKIVVSGEERTLSKKVEEFLQKLAKQEIVKRAKLHADKLNVEYNRITVRDTSSRWGSCSSKKNLSFSWRLIMAPEQVLEYVVAHEIAHLKEMNHSNNFWLLVESIFPNYRSTKNWLKENGTGLHSYSA
jgi:predicted metal-dependent hydrolase